MGREERRLVEADEGERLVEHVEHGDVRVRESAAADVGPAGRLERRLELLQRCRELGQRLLH
eukprot:5895659-Prymnesium_polylepis.1